MRNVNKQELKEYYQAPMIEFVDVKLTESYFASGGGVDDLPYNDGHWY